MANSEATFSAEIRSDLEDVYGENIHVNLIHDMHQTGKKPYDFYFNYNDHFTAIEAKRQPGHTFNFDNMVKEHQPGCLRNVIKSKGTGLFLICFNDHKTAFALTPDMMDMLIKEYGNSLKYDKFEMHTTTDQIIKIVRQKIKGTTRWHVEELIYASNIF